ncbi:MAG: hypothetical protein ACT4PU_00910 [Planctomycetota bacterium]
MSPSRAFARSAVVLSATRRTFCAAGPLAGRLAGGAVLLLGLFSLNACTSPLLDAPDQVRKSTVFLPPFYTAAVSDDGSSWEWSACFWLFGAEAEGPRRHARALPFYWHESAPAREWSLWFPLYYERTAADERTRFYSFLYGYTDNRRERSDYVLGPVFQWTRSRGADVWDSSLLLIYKWSHYAARNEFTLVPVFGLASLFRMESGLPADGGQVPALGRTSSRRFEVLNLLNFVALFGYDDVGDRREYRVLTLLSSEMLSPLRSWRGRGEDPFVRAWVFPLAMSVQDAAGGWSFLGPFWGEWSDAEAGTSTDWWLAGLLARTRDPQGHSWRLAGFPVQRSPAQRSGASSN